jgi:uncharacterized membrane protein (UPF0127 family)
VTSRGLPFRQHVGVTLDERRLKLLLAVALVLVGFGIWAFVLRGADGPANPSLAEQVDGSDPGFLPGDPERVLLDGFDELAISVDPGDGSSLLWCLLAALTQDQRARGLMEVTDLQGYSGMVFVYEDDVENSFYMRNTPMPLSIAWIAADGSVVTIEDMEPCEDRDGCPTYVPDGLYRYAIEVPQGHLDNLGVTEGSKVTVGGNCAPTT